MREMVAAVGFLFYVPIPHSLFLRPLFLAVYTAAGRQETSFSGKLPPLSSGGSAIHSIALGSPPLPLSLCPNSSFSRQEWKKISLPLLLFPHLVHLLLRWRKIPYTLQTNNLTDKFLIPLFSPPPPPMLGIKSPFLSPLLFPLYSSGEAGIRGKIPPFSLSLPFRRGREEASDGFSLSSPFPLFPGPRLPRDWPVILLPLLPLRDWTEAAAAAAAAAAGAAAAAAAAAAGSSGFLLGGEERFFP